MNILKLVNIHFKIYSNTLSERTYREILNSKYNVKKPYNKSFMGRK